MKSFQDKLCNGLTLLGLIAVIFGGIYTLVSEEDTEVKTEVNHTDSKNARTTPQDTIVADTLDKKPNLILSETPKAATVTSTPYSDTTVAASSVQQDSVLSIVKDSVPTHVHQASSIVPQHAATKSDTTLATVEQVHTAMPEQTPHVTDSI